MQMVVTFACALAAADVYVHPTRGDDVHNGGLTSDSPLRTLEAARSLAASCGASTVHVGGGVYPLSQPLKFTSVDNGVRWVTAPGENATISGGTPIPGPWGWWRRPSKGEPGVARTDVSTLLGRQDRHLWVNGRRAQRVRLPEAQAVELFSGSRMTDRGFVLSDGAPAAGFRAGAEFVYPQSTSSWSEPRCAVAAVNRTFIEMVQPCWRNLVHKACGQGARGPPSLRATLGLGAPHSGRGYVENLGEAGAAMALGEWALVNGSTVLLYALRPSEKLAGLAGGEGGEGGEGGGLAAALAAVVMPTLETLVEVDGASALTFEGLRFEHATWLRPGRADGYVEQQTGCCTLGDDSHNGRCDAQYDHLWSQKSAGNVLVRGATNVSFVRCDFTRLGGFGLDLTRSRGCLVDRCTFSDISGSAVQIGRFDGPLASREDAWNVVRDSRIERAAAEFSGAAAINVGYTVGTVIEHNDVHDLPYVGITVGWGWSRHSCAACTNAGWNVVRGNRVYDYKQVMNDGGGIYMLGPQNGTVVRENWVHTQHTATSGALYPDEGSAYSSWSHNVVTDIGRSSWLWLWTASIHRVTIECNFADTHAARNDGTDCPMVNNTVFAAGQPPAEARLIMAAAGVRNAASSGRP